MTWRVRHGGGVYGDCFVLHTPSDPTGSISEASEISPLSVFKSEKLIQALHSLFYFEKLTSWSYLFSVNNSLGRVLARYK